MTVESKNYGNCIFLHGDTLPEVWENAVLKCWENGFDFETQYDKEGDPKSKDCYATLVIENPFQEARIHKAFPAGLEDLEIYRQEVLFGVHDNWVDPDNGAWSYTYHDKLFNYKDNDGNEYYQIEEIIERLSTTPFTRRAQAITWNPFHDNLYEDPSCLQRVWCRIENGKLNMNVSMRSNDAFKASFMNMYAFTDMQRYIAEEISKKRGEEIPVGRYIHQADSFHIYGSYFEEFKKFVDRCKNTSFESRVIESEDVKDFFDSGKIILLNNTQGHIPIMQYHWDRLYSELPEDRKSEVNKKD